MVNDSTRSEFVVPISNSIALDSSIVGMKASWLSHIANAGLPLPETFIFLLKLQKTGSTYRLSQEARRQLHEAVSQIEVNTGKRLGSARDPLLLAARLSGGEQRSTYHTLLNLGLPLFGPIVIQKHSCSNEFLSIERQRLTTRFYQTSKTNIGAALADSRIDQRTVALMMIEEFIIMHFELTNSDALEKVQNVVAHALIVQEMQPSTLAPDELHVDVFSRDPSGAVDDPIGYIQMISHDGNQVEYSTLDRLKRQMPEHYEKVRVYCHALERLFGAVCQVRLDISGSQFYIISVHITHTTAEVLSKMLIEQVSNAERTEFEALSVAEPSWFQSEGHKEVSNKASLIPLGCGSSLGQKLVTGRIAIDPMTVDTMAAKNEPTVFVSEDLNLENVEILMKAAGVISMRGGITSHMSVIARGMGKVCVTGIEGASLLLTEREFRIGNRVLKEGDWITVDETKGLIYLGKGDLIHSRRRIAIEKIMEWANVARSVRVLVNADNIDEVKSGLQAGADGVGLCRSEHQLLETSILEAFRCMFLTDEEDKQTYFLDIVTAALANRLMDILRTLGGKPIHYRLLDAPINEFLPNDTQSVKSLARSLDVTEAKLWAKIDQLREENALLGCRGCRWGVVFSDFYERQIRLAIHSAKQVTAEGIPVTMTLILPMVSLAGELHKWLAVYQDELVTTHLGTSPLPTLEFGVMVETPRAALISSELAKQVSIFCFGTNDLTQAVWAMSRDDFSSYFNLYQKQGITDLDPFKAIDVSGVGQLIRMTIMNARHVRADAKFYVCGEHAGMSENIKWFIANGVDGVSCSADRVESAILAAAQAEIAPMLPNKVLYHGWMLQSRIQEYTESVIQRIVDYLSQGDRDKAVTSAYIWAIEVADNIGLAQTEIWKFFKRNLTIKWFGTWEYRRFAPGWSTEEALEYAQTLHDEIVRYSLFPHNIAAQAVSKVLPQGQPREVWSVLLNALDHSVAMEIFPQQLETKLSFRAVLNDFVLRVEAGFGQAINVFWQERGSHPVVTGAVDGRTQIVKIETPDTEANGSELMRIQIAIRTLLERYGVELLACCQDMCQTLGVEWIAVEGYYDAQENGRPFICDVDLPLDLAFYGS